MISINLIKEPSGRSKFRLSKDLRAEYFIGAAVLVAILGLVFWYWSLSTQKEAALAKRDDLQQQSLQLIALRKEVQRFEEQKRGLEERAQLIENLQASQRGPVRMMNAIIASIPGEGRLWLTRLAQEGNRVTIQGKAFDVPAIADFIANLTMSRPFQSVELDFWEEGEESVDFELSCMVGGN